MENPFGTQGQSVFGTQRAFEGNMVELKAQKRRHAEGSRGSQGGAAVRFAHPLATCLVLNVFPTDTNALQMRLGMLATRLLSTDGLIFDNAHLSCVCRILRLAAGFCLSGLCWTIAQSFSIGFQSGHTSFLQKSVRLAVRFAPPLCRFALPHHLAGPWRSDESAHRPA